LRSNFRSDSNFRASGGHISHQQEQLEAEGHDILCLLKDKIYLGQSKRPADHAVAFAAPTSASTIERKITRPSEEPIGFSMARSGCGIRPATLRSRLQMPAMLAIEPLGLPAASAFSCAAAEWSAPSGVV